jgi:uncharacterized protein YqiB (DUF1249 family)
MQVINHKKRNRTSHQQQFRKLRKIIKYPGKKIRKDENKKRQLNVQVYTWDN